MNIYHHMGLKAVCENLGKHVSNQLILVPIGSTFPEVCVLERKLCVRTLATNIYCHIGPKPLCEKFGKHVRNYDTSSHREQFSQILCCKVWEVYQILMKKTQGYSGRRFLCTSSHTNTSDILALGISMKGNN